MNAGPSALLDACVLLPMPLADTLLRMAETPRLYLPRWSSHIMAEISRNLTRPPWNKTAAQASRREEVLHAHFPEAWVAGYEPLIDLMNNDPGDRHVLAAAVVSGTKLIVTYNTRHFPESALAPWGIERQGPSTFLMGLYELDPGLVDRKLREQAQNLSIPLEDLLRRLRINVPGFVSSFCEQQWIDPDSSSPKGG